jgi:hypothetical protein
LKNCAALGTSVYRKKCINSLVFKILKAPDALLGDAVEVASAICLFLSVCRLSVCRLSVCLFPCIHPFSVVVSPSTFSVLDTTELDWQLLVLSVA